MREKKTERKPDRDRQRGKTTTNKERGEARAKPSNWRGEVSVNVNSKTVVAEFVSGHGP